MAAVNTTRAPVEQLVSTGTRILEAYTEKCQRESTSPPRVTCMVVAGEWMQAMNSLVKAVTEEEMEEAFKHNVFEDIVHDSSKQVLVHRDFWLRSRRFQGCSELHWSLTWDAHHDEKSNSISYKELLGPLAIVIQLQNEGILEPSLDPESTEDQTSQALHILQQKFPCEVTIYQCVRLSCKAWREGDRELRYDVAKLTPNHFYPLLSIRTVPLEVTDVTSRTTFTTVPSKTVASLAVRDRPYFQSLFPNATPPRSSYYAAPFFLKQFDLIISGKNDSE